MSIGGYLSWDKPFFVVQQPPATSLKQSVKDRLGPLIGANSEPSQDSTVASQVCVWVGDRVEGVLFRIYSSKSAGCGYRRCVFFPPLCCRISPKRPWKTVWVSLPNLQLLLRRWMSTHCSQLQASHSIAFLFKLSFTSCVFRCFPHPWDSLRRCTIRLPSKRPRKPQRKPWRRSRWGRE